MMSYPDNMVLTDYPNNNNFPSDLRLGSGYSKHRHFLILGCTR